jgi:integrase
MGRRRKTDNHLPERVYKKHGAFYYVDRNNKWNPLAKEYPEALSALARLLKASSPTGTIDHLIAKYESEELPKKAKATQKSRLQEFRMLRKAFGAMPADSIRPSDVWNYYRARGEIEQARHEVRALSAVLTFARRIGAMNGENPCFGLRFKGSGARERYVTDAEYLVVRDLAPQMIGLAMDLALVAGFRKADILALERRHLLADGIQIETSKDGKLLLIEWNDELRMTIDAAFRIPPRVRQFVICRRDGKRYTADGFGAMWQRLMAKAMKRGLAERFTFHDLRAKSATDAESDEEATARLGHNDPKLTKRVYRRLPKRAKALRIVPADAV